MILSLLLLLVLFQSQKLNEDLKTANRRLQSASPIIIDEESGNYKFASGSAELNQDFKNYINNTIIPKIETNLKEREIDFIQIIGHTDGQANNSNSSSKNLDKILEEVAQRNQSVRELKPGSNADLGLMRALAVVIELQSSQKLENAIEKYLLENNLDKKDFSEFFRAYSAAQLYLPSGELAKVDRQPDEARRRIEIRFIPPGESKKKQN